MAAPRDYEKIRAAEMDKAWVTQLVGQYQASEFFGKITLTMEKGVIRRIVKEETLIPPSASP